MNGCAVCPSISAVPWPARMNQRLLVLARGVPAYRLAGHEADEPAPHPRRLRRSFQQGAVPAGAG